MTDLPIDRPLRRTHLFILRLWIEPLAAERAEVRGRVQHVLSGEARYFCTWPELVAFVEGVLTTVETQCSEPGKEIRP